MTAITVPAGTAVVSFCGAVTALIRDFLRPVADVAHPTSRAVKPSVAALRNKVGFMTRFISLF